MEEKPRCLVFLVPGFPADEADTACLPAVQNYVAACAKRHPGRRVHVLAFQYPYRQGTYRWRGVTVHALAGQNRRRAARLATWKRAVRRFRQLHRREEIVGIHSFWLAECALVGQYLARWYRLPHVASIAGQDARRENPYLRFLAFRRMILTAGSSFAAETFREATGWMVDAVIPLGLDEAFLSTLEEKVPRTTDVLGVGALTPIKNFSTFVDIVGKVVPAVSTLRACLIGDGPERDALVRQVAAGGLEQHIRLVGALPREVVFRHMLRSKVLLHPSTYEGQGYVFLEALRAGMYVVRFEVGYAGTNEKVFSCRSAAHMQEVLARLLQEPLSHAPVRVHPVEDTVRAFEAVYRRG